MNREVLVPEYALPPILPMDPTYQIVFTCVTFVLAIAATGYLIREGRKHGTYMPVLLLIGGGAAVIFEPLLDMLMMCVYPHEGQWQYIALWGRKIPVYEGLTYFFYFPVAIWYFYKRFERGAQPSELWRSVGVLYVCQAAFETGPVQLGLWQYFGDHPLQVFGVPLLLISIGPPFIIGPAFVLWRLKQRLVGVRAALVIGLVPLLIAAFGLAAVMPYSAGMHHAPANMAVKYIGAFATVISCILLLWICLNTRAAASQEVHEP